MAECLDCKHAIPMKDSHGEYHSICICVESDDFLNPIDLAFGGCECGEPEEEDDHG